MTEQTDGIEIKSEEQAYWDDIAEKTRQEIKTLKKMLKFNEAVLRMAGEESNKAEKKLKSG